MLEKKDITGIILAGGKSSRMGTDKGFLKLNDKLFIEHSIDALKALVSEIIIISNSNDYDVFGYKRINDKVENSGPLAGIYTGLIHSETEYNLVLSCDIPLIKTELLKLLIEADEEKYDIIQFESNGKMTPLIALYKKNCTNTFYNLLNSGERRLQYAINQCEFKRIHLKKEHDYLITNVNTNQELKDLKNAYNY
ncbi:MAG: molybdenum cofactor guanylyltransferase [Flaviramulus sp.]|nr:molybdenum cofactor guanylyltransferase [Flaviramulus sp.]